MTALEHKLWIESYEASTEHTSAEDDIYLCIGYWQDRIDRGESRQQMLFAGCDPDMLNEYAMAMDLYWPEIDAHYDQTNPLHQAICKYKKQRATAIQEHRDPGAVPEKVQKYFTLAKKSRRPVPTTEQPTARQTRRSAENVAPAAVRSEQKRQQRKPEPITDKAAIKNLRKKWGVPALIFFGVVSILTLLYAFITNGKFDVNAYSSPFNSLVSFILWATLIINNIGYRQEKSGKPISPIAKWVFALHLLTADSVLHPIHTFGSEIKSIPSKPLAILNLVYSLLCFVALIFGGFVIAVIALVFFAAGSETAFYSSLNGDVVIKETHYYYYND